MSNLEELIKEYCPNGVDYVKIKDVFTRLKGTLITAGKMKEIETSNGEIKIFAGGKTVINANESDIPNANITRVPAVLVQSRGVIDFIYYDQPFTFKNEMWAYTAKNIITVKYLYYVLKNNVQYFRESASGMGALPQISLGVTEDFIVPLPALPVQREIVRILDSFTLYSAELTAELTARRKQYEFYRDKLLHYESCNKIETIGENIEWLKTGLNPRQNFKLNEPEANCFYITGKDIFNNRVNVTEKTDKITQNTVLLINKRANLQDNILLFASTGTGTVGRMAVIDRYDFSWNVSETMYCIKPKGNKLLVKYLMYFLYSQTARNEFEPKISKGSVPHLKVADLLNVHINLPPIEVQERIVKVLDNFDAICSDLGIGLPAEIEKRQKQYEYYRDKLLSFDINVDKVINTTGGATAN